jgi:hypothetical protein
MRAAVIAVAVFSLFCTPSSNALTIYLGDQNRGPGGDLNISGITFSSGAYYTGQPTTVAGSGAGSATVGPSYSVDALWYAAAGSVFANPLAQEGLSLTPGEGVRLNSITLVPHFSLSGYEGSESLLFGIAYYIGARNAMTGTSYLTVQDNVPLTIDLYSDYYDIARFDLFLDSDGANDIRFSDYRRTHGTPESTFQFGFTIQSMDITISETVVPEPGSAALLSIGLFGFGYARRRMKNRF